MGTPIDIYTKPVGLVVIEGLMSTLAQIKTADGYHIDLPLGHVYLEQDAPTTRAHPYVAAYPMPGEVKGRDRTNHDQLTVVLCYGARYLGASAGGNSARAAFGWAILGDIQRAVGHGFVVTVPQTDPSMDDANMNVHVTEVAFWVSTSVAEAGVVEGYLEVALSYDRDRFDPRAA